MLIDKMFRLIDNMVVLIDQMFEVGSTCIGQPEGDVFVINVLLFMFLFSVIFIGTTVINFIRKRR